MIAVGIGLVLVVVCAYLVLSVWQARKRERARKRAAFVREIRKYHLGFLRGMAKVRSGMARLQAAAAEVNAEIERRNPKECAKCRETPPFCDCEV